MRNERNIDDTSFEELFYKRLVQLRELRKVSARDMSLSIGQNPGYINGLENRKGLPSMTVFFYICEYLNVSPKEFFDDSVECPEQISRICDEIKTLDQEALTLLEMLIKRIKKE
ncbi:MAG: helix-turn-helix transcriptional regulator [Lachnospiraceae bacterium]|nr:helix-turn-helix transcriptional regulator [Lachnospiraceae bacterium]